jgi:hypothetical protein
VLSLSAAFGVETLAGRRWSKSQQKEVDPRELDARTVLASAIGDAGEFELAQVEFSKVLVLDPNNLPARFARIAQASEARRFDLAGRDLDAVLNHPELFNYLRKQPRRILRLHRTSRLFLENGRVEEARKVARAARDFAITLKEYCGESHYYLARVYAVDARSNPASIIDAAKQLYNAFTAHTDFQRWYEDDRWFDPVRIQTDAELRRMPDPAGIQPRRPVRLTAR